MKRLFDRKCVLLRWARVYWKRIGRRVALKERYAILTGTYEEDLT